MYAFVNIYIIYIQNSHIKHSEATFDINISNKHTHTLTSTTDLKEKRVQQRIFSIVDIRVENLMFIDPKTVLYGYTKKYLIHHDLKTHKT